MIASDEFYRGFDAGFAPAVGTGIVAREKRAPARYRVRSRHGVLRIWFKVNPKASAIPHQPGEWWPVIHAPEQVQRAAEDDDGMLSWYQYASREEIGSIHVLRRRVVEKVAAQDNFEEELWRGVRDAGAGVLALTLDSAPEPRFPHTPLYYLDATDAEEWGRLFAEHLPLWVERFDAAPETLLGYMQRVVWS